MEGFQSQQWLFSELRGFLLVHLFFATSLTGKISNLDPECGSALAASVSFYLPHEYHLKLNMMPYSSMTYLYIRYLLLDINTLMCNVVLITVEFWMEVVASNRFVLYACGRKKILVMSAKEVMLNGFSVAAEKLTLVLHDYYLDALRFAAYFELSWRKLFPWVSLLMRK